MQSDGIDMDFENCLARIEKDVDELMNSMNKPELILGVEMGIGRYFAGSENELSGDTIPGAVTEKLSAIAEKYGIYFMPGSMLEKAEKDGREVLYNSAPIFGPDGRMIDVYRKMCPYYPLEGYLEKGDRYVTFRIEEKDITVGAMICHDWCFPEISRNLALRGAELLIRPAIDPEGLYDACITIPQTRAFENQCYFISLNMSGYWLGGYAYGRSMIADPDGRVIYEAGGNPTCVTVTLDMDKARNARVYGTLYTEQLIRQLKVFDPPMDIYGDLSKAPVYDVIPDPDMTVEERDRRIAGNRIKGKQQLKIKD